MLIVINVIYHIDIEQSWESAVILLQQQIKLLVLAMKLFHQNSCHHLL